MVGRREVRAEVEGNMSDGGRKDAIISSEAWRASASLGSCRAALRRSPTGRGQGQKHMRGLRMTNMHIRNVHLKRQREFMSRGVKKDCVLPQ